VAGNLKLLDHLRRDRAIMDTGQVGDFVLVQKAAPMAAPGGVENGVIDAVSPGRNRAGSPNPIGSLVESGQPTAIRTLLLKDVFKRLHPVPRDVLRNTKPYLIGSVRARIVRRPIVPDARSLRALRLPVSKGLDLGELGLRPVVISEVVVCFEHGRHLRW